MLAAEERSGQKAYCPNCRALNRISMPEKQHLGEEGLAVPRISFINWYLGVEPTNQQAAFKHAKDHLAHIVELIEERGLIKLKQTKKLQATIPNAEIPEADFLNSDHVEFLQNAYSYVRLNQSGMSIKLAEHVEEIRGLFKRRQNAKTISTRFLQRAFAEVELEIVSRELMELCSIDRLKTISAQVKDETLQFSPPDDLHELVEDYRSRFADYVAAIETHAPEINIPNTEHLASRGGLPEDVAATVESAQLSVDNLRVTLRNYQKFGVKYIVEQKRTILGDEMGLGKTIEALGAMVHLQARESATRFIVIAPAGLIYNWRDEILNRTELSCHILHGKERGQNVENWNRTGGIAVTSFSTLWSLNLDFTKTIDLLIVDEAHKVKNQSAERSRLTEKLAACSKRVCLMTGTPMENKVHEFMNLIHICNNRLASDLRKDPEFQNRTAEDFRDSIASVYLRRNQVDVLTELPDSIDYKVWIELSKEDRKNYDTIKEGTNIQHRRQAANGTTISSSKMRRLAELLDTYREEGRKVIVFSNFIKTLDLAGIIAGEHFSIRGSVHAKERLAICKQFNKSDGFKVLIGQIEACGVGLNLQSASAVIIMEPQFKPTTEWQAIARAKRMGQTRSVAIYRLLAIDTVDENLCKLIEGKAQDFDDYARKCSVKEFSQAATDITDIELSHQLLKMEK